MLEKPQQPDENDYTIHCEGYEGIELKDITRDMNIPAWYEPSGGYVQIQKQPLRNDSMCFTEDIIHLVLSENCWEDTEF